MFIIGGVRRTTKIMGVMSESLCGRCNNRTARKIMKLTTWFTFFFIPIIPYRRQYLLVCPICGLAQQLTKAEFNSLVETAANNQAPSSAQVIDLMSDDMKYAGKTPTQIAFLKHMESVNQKRNAEQG